ncbi:MAG TPA: MCE family protein [Candidatus Hydrogenedentes bacterium]|nr:MCE family protein [Candidatus Hydrogenedentota bacterium]
MATRVQKTKVGIFLVCATAILAIMVALISGFEGEKTDKYYVEFNESVLGLSEGGLVEYLGVPVGEIKDILVTESKRAQVEVAINPDKVTLHEGVRAHLAIYSLAMGTMCISLEGGDPNGAKLAPGATIESTPSTIESIGNELEGILEALNVIGARLREGLEGIEKGELIAIARNAGKLITEGREFLAAARASLDRVTEHVEPGVEGLHNLIDAWQALSGDTHRLVTNLNDLVEKLKDRVDALEVADTQADFRKVLQNLDQLISTMQKTAGALDTATQALLHDADNVEYTLRDTLNTLNEALGAIRDLAEYLKEDPAALVRGKGEPKGD